MYVLESFIGESIDGNRDKAFVVVDSNVKQLDAGEVLRLNENYIVFGIILGINQILFLNIGFISACNNRKK